MQTLFILCEGGELMSIGGPDRLSVLKNLMESKNIAIDSIQKMEWLGKGPLQMEEMKAIELPYVAHSNSLPDRV